MNIAYFKDDNNNNDYRPIFYFVQTKMQIKKTDKDKYLLDLIKYI